jgi:WD40 repeat protein
MALTITQLTFSPASDLLVSEGIDGTTRLWDVESGMALKVIDAGDLYLYNTTRFTPDGRLLITAVSGVIRLWGLPPWP